MEENKLNYLGCAVVDGCVEALGATCEGDEAGYGEGFGAVTMGKLSVRKGVTGRPSAE